MVIVYQFGDKDGTSAPMRYRKGDEIMETEPVVFLFGFWLVMLLAGLFGRYNLRKNYDRQRANPPTVIEKKGKDGASPAMDFEENGVTLITSMVQASYATCLTFASFGLAFPLVILEYYRWIAFHTIYKGKRLRFTATLGDMYKRVITESLLTVVTLGIYLFLRNPNRWYWQHVEVSD